MVKKMQIFDPPMCCSTGLCGPSVDPELVRFAADVDWLKKKGIPIERFNLAQQPEAFTKSTIVKKELLNDENCLPLILIDDEIVSKGKYISREQLIKFVDLNVMPSIYTEQVEELVAIGAAIASNCENCFKFHYKKALTLGVSNDDMLMAVETANAVKNVPAKAILTLAHRILFEPTNFREIY